MYTPFNKLYTATPPMWLLVIDKDLHDIKMPLQFVCLLLNVLIIYQEISLEELSSIFLNIMFQTLMERFHLKIPLFLGFTIVPFNKTIKIDSL